ncbi:MAG: 50S ribosomal protein L11 methyltransferase [Deltaproteobacteria bacterium]|nr:50S ribosomal protein L11 methyltransferase [Deltaproteobacteria bacterium]
MSMVELHRLMLRDKARNAAFAQAISRQVQSGDVVVDLGAGTGMLSMMAARAGAKRVHAIEAADIFALGKKITRANGFEKIITWHHAPSYEIELREKATVLISETFGSHPFEECAHEFVRDARERLGAKNARRVPSRVRVFVAAAEAPALRDDWDLFRGPVAGFDLSLLRDATLSQMYAHELPAGALLSPPALLEDVELGDKTSSRRVRETSVRIARAGTLTQIVQWFELDLGAGVVLSTAPDQPPTHWRQLHFPLREATRVKQGDVVRVKMAIDTRVDRPVSVICDVEIRKK